MIFLIINSYLPSVLNFRGKLLEAIAEKGFEIHIIAPDLDFSLPSMKNYWNVVITYMKFLCSVQALIL